MPLAWVDITASRFCSGKKITSYRCKECSYERKYRSSVVEHIRVKHTGEKPFLCGLCNYASSNQGNLNSHLATHFDMRNYACQICGSAFKTQSQLNGHMRYHYAEKKFVCEICAKKFVNNTLLKQHLLTHTSECSFYCQYCQKGFKTRPLVRRHEATHTGAGRFQCDICGASFWRKDYWRAHMQAKHGENMEKYKRKLAIHENRKTEEAEPHSLNECGDTGTIMVMVGPEQTRMQEAVLDGLNQAGANISTMMVTMDAERPRIHGLSLPVEYQNIELPQDVLESVQDNIDLPPDVLEGIHESHEQFSIQTLENTETTETFQGQLITNMTNL
ncbi:gastrula zinc finger protein XlCGF46.1-like [Dreissena polymorpha]|uniref:gastrula zinc finger protein XlCGF46.1-like n=1 Tax=Dreissena polymorpha TaxID=45954 RepID=UPI0022644EB3|nr:gastrula zinc finger protein XlCGF46.1-like [Dreissena polymorpha]